VNTGTVLLETLFCDQWKYLHVYAASQQGEGKEQPTHVCSVSNAAVFSCGFSETDVFADFLHISFISPGGNSLKTWTGGTHSVPFCMLNNEL
jgi:hypothetical protein